MKRLARVIAFLAIAAQGGILCAQESSDRTALIREIINRSRLLEDAHFRLPRSVWRRFVIDQAKGSDYAPVSHIISRGVYRLKADAKGSASIEAEIHLLVLDSRQARAVAVLSNIPAWSDITLDGAAFAPAAKGKWLVFQPEKPGSYVIRARSPIEGFKAFGGTFTLPIVRTVLTSATLDSPSELEVTASGSARGSAGKKVSLTLKPSSKLVLNYRPLQRRTVRRATYQVSGAVAWNFGPAAQQVSADLRVAILGGKTESLELVVPNSAKRVAISGPDVRDVRISGRTATVFFRGAITGRTRLKLNYELPAAKGAADLPRPEISNGRWSGGTLVITNTAGGSEIQPADMSGLKEIALGDIPRAASAILAGKAVMAYSITSGRWFARAESIDLGEFAIKQTLADSARYQFSYRPDGSVICRADYEIRNRNRQFLRVTLPAGAKVLLARVSEKSRPMTPLGGKKNQHLLPLERSTASVMGLVSFPVQVVYMYRAEALKSRGSGAIALPQIDIPIAYAWCQANMPDGMSRVKFSGVMQPVEQYSSETALASMTYGSATALDPERKRIGLPQTEKKPPPKKGDGGGGGVLSWLLGSKDAVPEDRPPAVTTSVTAPSGGTILAGGQISSSSGSLARNYWRAGKDLYDKGKYAEADKALNKVIEMSRNSPDASNAKRLLSNIKLLQGKLKVQSRAEKAAAVTVKQQFTADNVDELQRQSELVEEGIHAVRRKDTKRAQALFQAAEALGKKLVAKGENVVEQEARLRIAKQQLGIAQKTASENLGRGLKQIKELRKSGRIDEAGALAEKLAKETSELSNTGGADITKDFQLEREQLALASAKETLKKNTYGQWKGARRSPRPGKGRGQGQGRQEGKKPLDRITPLIHQQSELVPAGPDAPANTSAGKKQAAAGHLRRGRKLLDAGDASGAAGELKAAVALDPTLVQARRLLTLSNRLTGLSDGAGVTDKPVRRPSVTPGELTPVRRLGTGSIGGERLRDYDRDGAYRRGDSPLVDLQPNRDVTGDAVQVYKVGDLVTALSDADEDGLEDIAGKEEGRRKRTSKLTDQIKSLLKNGQVQVTTYDGQRALKVRGGFGEQRAVSALIEGLRKARGPQVQVGANLALQQGLNKRKSGGWSYEELETHKSDTPGITSLEIAGGTVSVEGGDADRGSAAATDHPHSVTDGTLRGKRLGGAKVDPSLQKFIDRNYSWQIRPGQPTDSGVLPTGERTVAARGNIDTAELASKLRFNRWQKTQVSSLNLNVDASSVNALGLKFHKGNNDVSFTVVDEAQFRTLMEVDASRRGAVNGDQVDPNETRQETIVGTDALLANSMTTNVTYSRDRGNTLDIADNPISLSHEKYVLIDNGGYLTAVRAGEMQHWREASKHVEFVKAPQTIEIPRVGELVKLEKTLVKPGDEMVIRFDYQWKGR
ncbi:MAG: hypothetical protein QGG42_21445 [Phycisphaerae bacterium]|jgi:tetratricopeptide (TPR) repeat protein|nr:hypothetical protein [Phycisphaerae bacterium]